MRFRDYMITSENLPRIRRLGYTKFALIYGVIPSFLILPIWIPAWRWLSSRGSIYSDVFDILSVLELARDLALLAPLVGIVFGTLMWSAIVGTKPEENGENHPRKLRPMWQVVGLILTGVGIGVSIGVSAGIWIYRDKMSPWEDSQIAYGAAWYEYLSVRDLYLNGNYHAARKALLEYIEVLSQISDRHLEYTGFLEPRLEMAHTYCRLSLLEESEGKADEAKRHWDQGTSLLKSAGWKEVKREKILLTLKAIDLALPEGIDIPESGENP